MNKLEKAIKEIKEVRIADEKFEDEKKYNEWFDNLLLVDQADIGEALFKGLSLEEKIRLYELE